MAGAIPVVSFEKFLTGTRDDQKEVAKQVYDAFSTVGFIYLKNTGISQARVDEIFELVCMNQKPSHHPHYHPRRYTTLSASITVHCIVSHSYPRSTLLLGV